MAGRLSPTLIHSLEVGIPAKLRPIATQIDRLEEGGFAYLPANVPHAFLNVTDAPGEVIVVYTPGGGIKFHEELAELTRNGSPEPKVVAQLFEEHGLKLLGPPLSLD